MTYGKNLHPLTEQLFDCLTDTVFFTKDPDGRYLSANQTLVVRCGLKSKSELIGRRPSDVLGQLHGGSYEGQDSHVLSTGEAISNRLELHSYPNRKLGWCLTNKFALFDRDSQVIGVAGISQDLRAPDNLNSEYGKVADVIDHVAVNLADPPSIAALADRAGLSPYQLDRRIKSIFGLTTGQWILRQRLDLAGRQLSETRKDLSEIALDCGYADQSAFTRQFRRATGVTPSQFRKMHAAQGRSD